MPFNSASTPTLTLREAAKRLKLSRRYLQLLAIHGRLPGAVKQPHPLTGALTWYLPDPPSVTRVQRGRPAGKPTHGPVALSTVMRMASGTRPHGRCVYFGDGLLWWDAAHNRFRDADGWYRAHGSPPPNPNLP